MTGNDNEGSQSVYGSEVEIVTSGSVTPTSATASNKVSLNILHLEKPFEKQFSIIYQSVSIFVPYSTCCKFFQLYFALCQPLQAEMSLSGSH